MVFSNKLKHYCFVSLLSLFFLSLCTGCNEGKSYSDMLREEEVAVNWYLAQQRVEPYVPEDSVFEVGKNAPFYRMDPDGNVYMRVINTGDMTRRPKKGDTVYFRFMRTNIKYIYTYGEENAGGEGNSEDMSSNLGGMNLIYGNETLQSTTDHGTGLQVPLGYLGYDCEVELVVKSVAGRSGDMSQCVPYVYKGLKYFKAEY